VKFKPAIWFPIAVVASLVNVVSVWFAAAPAEPMHATIHAALAVAFGLWAQRLQRGVRAGLRDRLEEAEAFRALEEEVGTLREALAESQTRLEFSEQLMARRRDGLPAEVPRDADQPRAGR
jgi:hypothetical protein